MPRLTQNPEAIPCSYLSYLPLQYPIDASMLTFGSAPLENATCSAVITPILRHFSMSPEHRNCRDREYEASIKVANMMAIVASEQGT